MPFHDASQSSAPPLTTDDFHAQLYEDIQGGDLLPGTKLPSERQFAERYGISRPVVRESLRRLQERGLIVVQPGRGSYVREVRATQGNASAELLAHRGQITARQLARAREMLESEACALAAVNHNQSELATMRQILAAFESAPDVAVASELDLALHEAIVVASGNTVMQIMFGAIRGLTLAVMVRSLTDRNVSMIGAPLHHVIVDAISGRDAIAAREAMTEHLRIAEQQYGRDIDEPLADVLRRRATEYPDVADLLRRASSAIAATVPAFSHDSSSPQPHDPQRDKTTAGEQASAASIPSRFPLPE
jgi:GntR family transcriptional repressor for pyruvate dehydrogenase complex